ncbi:MAG: inositol monophosphatase [Candidatus Tectomicrobia bacterium]|uniref:Inositol-1-monophosphatase n=1 Tax=Tectimicrobiota bacterium TaxID=2528274 RepID=A0A932GQ45_UNCTE|nr:inositol monophosphatase [Candidatus Tectomicrobia bacterium]
MNELLQAAREMALKAGKLLKEYWVRGVEVEYKGEINLVTEADRASEALILSEIRRRFPDHSIVAEESAPKQVPGEFCWYVDPLDGTTNFAHKLPYFSVSIGVRRGQEMVAGVIYDPILEELFCAARGEGATCNDRLIRVSPQKNLGESLLVTGFNYTIRQDSGQVFEHFRNFTMVAQGVRRVGSAALDLCYVACGRYEGFWERDLSPWDTAAGTLLVEEAGGRVTQFGGEPFDLYGAEVLASNSLIHETMTEVLRRPHHK